MTKPKSQNNIAKDVCLPTNLSEKAKNQLKYSAPSKRIVQLASDISKLTLIKSDGKRVVSVPGATLRRRPLEQPI